MSERLDRIENKEQGIGTIEGDKSRPLDVEFYNALKKDKPEIVHKKKIPYGISARAIGMWIAEMLAKAVT